MSETGELGMQALVIYESLTGNTRRAAALVAQRLTARGVPTRTCSVTGVDYQALEDADLVIVGAWTDGFVFVGQRPGRAGRLRRLPAMAGKRCVVFCTYAIDPGNTLGKLSAILEGRGADVIGGMALRRDRLEAAAADFVDRVIEAVPA